MMSRVEIKVNEEFGMKKWIFVVLLFLLMGCGGGGNVETAVTDSDATVDPAAALQAKLQSTIEAQQGDRAEQIATWLTELDAAEAKWAANEVENYTITVNYTGSHTVNQTIYIVEVQNGEIADYTVSCLFFGTNNSCINEEVAENTLTVPGLFALARKALTTDTINDGGNGFRFEEELGYPRHIALKSQGTWPWAWRITGFEINE